MSHASTLVFGKGTPYGTALRAAARLLALCYFSILVPQ